MIALVKGSLVVGLGAMLHAAVADGACQPRPRFVPGPIVAGHPRQPTPFEVETRLRELQAWDSACATWPQNREAQIPHGPAKTG